MATHNFRVVHRYGVSTTPRVIQCLNTGHLSDPIGDKPGIVEAHGHKFHVLKAHVGVPQFVPVHPYEGKWPRLTFWFKRTMEMFA